MIRLSKMTDYAIVLMGYMSRYPIGQISTSRGLSEESKLPLPTVSKILKRLSRSGLLVSHRGNKGGYTLVRKPDEISVAAIISSMEGGLALTECASEVSAVCELEESCPVRGNWKRINDVVFGALSGLTIEEMATPVPQSYQEIDQPTLLTLVER